MKKLLFSLALPLLFLSISYAQEICNDGIDNDGDGFIDCFDGDCANNIDCDGHYFGNNASCEATPSSFPSFSMRLGYQSVNDVTLNLSSIAVGDLDRDGMPEILSTNQYTNKIYLLNGSDGSVKQETSINKPNFSSASMVNLEDDNCGEVFIINNNPGYRINSFDCDLNQIWTSEVLPNDPVMVSFADFDRDGQAEMYYKDEIRDPITGIRLVATSEPNWDDIPSGGVAVDIFGDEDLELVLGNKIYSVNLGGRTADAGSLTLIATMPEYYQVKAGSFASGLSASTSIADYNLDGYLDVIVTGADGANVTSVFFWDVINNTVKTFSDPRTGYSNYALGWRRGAGRVNIGDIDGDGQLNAVFVSGGFLYALDENWEHLWKDAGGNPAPIRINDETSGLTAATLFDFNGDGQIEIVYRDEDYLYIIDGDGNINTTVHCRSRSHIEYPIVADVDADGSAEICVTCASENFKPTALGRNLELFSPAEVRVYKSDSEPWVPSRKVWNQHAYFNVNINDDLTVPRNQQKHQLVWSTGTCAPGAVRPLNGFLNQSPLLNSNGCPTFAAPDLAIVDNSFAITQPSCPDTDFTVSFEFENIGEVPLSGNVPFTFYDGDPLNAGTNKLSTEFITLSNFAVGQTMQAIDIPVTATGGPFTLYAVLNDNGTTTPTPITLPNSYFLECDYENNIISAAVNPLPFVLTTEKTNNVSCDTGSVPPNGSARVYSIINGNDETVDSDFYWYNSTTVSGAADYTGSIYTDLSAGTYSVFAINKLAGCTSDTLQVVIEDSVITLNAAITVDQAHDDCSTPNGALSVALNGSDPVGNYNYEWYVGNSVGGGLVISRSNTASGLDAGVYTVLVTDKATGCQTIESEEVSDETVSLNTTDAGIDIETCSAEVPLNADASGVNESGSWSITSSPIGIATPATFEDIHTANTNFIINDFSITGDYILRWTITDEPNNCFETFDEVTISYEAPPSAGILNGASTVNLTIADSPFDLFSMLADETTGGIWELTLSDNNNGTAPIYDATTGLVDLSAANTGNYEFTYTVNGIFTCATDSIKVSLDFENYDCTAFNFSTTTKEASCSANTDGSLTVSFENVSHADSLLLTINLAQENVVTLVTANPGNGGILNIDYGFATGDYQLIVEDLLLGCKDSLQFTIGFGNPISTAVIGSENESYGALGDGSITLETINTGTDYEIFLNGTSYATVASATSEYTLENLSAGTYQIEVVDLSTSCSATLTTSITQNPNTATDILSFTIEEQVGETIIDAANHSIILEVAYGTDLSNKTAEIEVSAGATISPSATTTVDLSEVITYMVTAEDGISTQAWQVTVNILPAIKQDQTISFEMPATLYQDQSPFPLEASASSGLAVQFTVESGSATVSNNQLFLTGPSTVVVKAFQAGNDTLNYAEAEKTLEVIGTYDVSINVLRPNEQALERGLAKLFTPAGGLYAKENFTAGNLSFSNVRNGEYILQVIPLGSNTSDIFPTYYSDTHFHKEATIIQVDDELSINMYMKEKDAASSGIGQISGRVIQSAESSQARVALNETAEGEGIAELIIYLIDQSSGTIVSAAVSDEAGDFSMPAIPYGNYDLIIDIPGLENAATTYELAYESPNQGLSLTIFLNAEGIVNVDINTILGNTPSDFTFNMYPNPTNGILYLDGYKGKEQTVKLISTNGKEVKTIQLTAESNQKIDLTDLEDGIYFLITNSKQQGLIKIIKK